MSGRRKTRRSSGRPRSLTLEAIIDAASAIEMDELCMAQVARRLDVGVATLYGYVKGIEELITLISQKKAQALKVQDHGQPWQEIIADHAAQSFQTIVDWPEQIQQIMGRADFTKFEADYMEYILGLLTARGLPPHIALSLYHETNQLIFGATVTKRYLCSFEKANTTQEAKIRQLIADSPASAYPITSKAIRSRSFKNPLGDYTPSLQRLIASYEQLLEQ